MLGAAAQRQGAGDQIGPRGGPCGPPLWTDLRPLLLNVSTVDDQHGRQLVANRRGWRRAKGSSC